MNFIDVDIFVNPFSKPRPTISVPSKLFEQNLEVTCEVKSKQYETQLNV